MGPSANRERSSGLRISAAPTDDRRLGAAAMQLGRLRPAVAVVWIGLSVGAAACAAIASAAGLTIRSTYARETELWAVQGEGQDAVNLVVIVPLLAVCAWLARTGSATAALVWFGLLLYLAYSYVLYAFFVHFNGLFLVYVATLGLSVWAICGAAWQADARAWAARFANARGERPLAVLFLASAALFGAMWLSEIVPAVAFGATPQSAIDAGLIVNPVHVLDLAFALPALAAAGLLLWMRRPLGFLAAVPLGVFTMAMSAAIIGMAIAVGVRGLGSAAVAAPMTLLALLTARFVFRMMRTAE